MKVIQQLTQHFWDQGALSPNQVDYLVVRGYVHEEDLNNYQLEPAKEAKVAPLPDFDSLTHWEERLEGSCRRLAGRGKKRSRKPELHVTTDQVLERVGAELGRRARRCSALTKIEHPRLPGGKPRWQDYLPIARRLRAVLCVDFRSAVTLIALQPQLLAEMWRAIDMLAFHTIVGDRRLRGPAANALRVLLRVGDRRELGAYGWILKYEPLRLLADLCHIRRRFLSVLGYMHERHFRQLHAAVACGVDSSLFWALVLVHNARRADPNASFPSRGGEYKLLRPERDVWLAAIGLAREIDGQRVAEWMTPRYLPAERFVLAISHLDCPDGWHVPPTV